MLQGGQHIGVRCRSCSAVQSCCHGSQRPLWPELWGSVARFRGIASRQFRGALRHAWQRVGVVSGRMGRHSELSCDAPERPPGDSRRLSRLPRRVLEWPVELLSKRHPEWGSSGQFQPRIRLQNCARTGGGGPLIHGIGIRFIQELGWLLHRPRKPHADLIRARVHRQPLARKRARGLHALEPAATAVHDVARGRP